MKVGVDASARALGGALDCLADIAREVDRLVGELGGRWRVSQWWQWRQV